MSTPHRATARIAVIATAALAGAAACHRERARDAEREQVNDLAQQAAQLATAERSPVDRATVPNSVGLARVTGAADDSVRIASTDGAVIYTLVRDTVRMQLGDSVIRQVRQKVNANADSASGNFGGFIARTVAGAVGSAMTFVMRTPVRDIRSATYKDGELRIETSGGPLHHGTISTGGKHDGDHNTTFAPADGERFVAAIHARQRALGVR